MRKLIVKLLLLAAPLAVLAALVVAVDPFNFFGGPSLLSDRLKVRNRFYSGATMPAYNMLAKLVEYRRQPVANLIIGDSRLTRFNARMVEELTGEAFYNFGVPGGNYRSMVDTFWYADRLVPLKTVYLQVSFRTYGAGDWDIFSEAEMTANSVWYHLASRRVLGATFLGLRSLFFERSMQYAYDDHPPGFWAKVLESERGMVRRFRRPVELLKELTKIAEHCRAKGIRLVLIDLPSHLDAQRLVTEAGLEEERERYRQEMMALGTYYDFNRTNRLTVDRTLYVDPLHALPAVPDEVIRQIWRGPLVDGQVYGRTGTTDPTHAAR
ncbi:MAG: hypothetical protein ACYDC1_10530 [Limisphaerales bacterium]